MLRKVRIASIVVATLLASPAFAGWPADQPAQLDLIGGQRIIREIVVDGHLTETDSDAAPASELDRRQRRSRSSASTLILKVT
jgi:hypothetical protein